MARDARLALAETRLTNTTRAHLISLKHACRNSQCQASSVDRPLKQPPALDASFPNPGRWKLGVSCQWRALAVLISKCANPRAARAPAVTDAMPPPCGRRPLHDGIMYFISRHRTSRTGGYREPGAISYRIYLKRPSQPPIRSVEPIQEQEITKNHRSRWYYCTSSSGLTSRVRDRSWFRSVVSWTRLPFAARLRIHPASSWSTRPIVWSAYAVRRILFVGMCEVYRLWSANPTMAVVREPRATVWRKIPLCRTEQTNRQLAQLWNSRLDHQTNTVDICHR